MSSDLTIDLSTLSGAPRGPRLVPIEELVREVVPLELEDISELQTSGPSRSMSGLKHIKAYHHMVALRLAGGERPVEICAAIGISPQTITRLQQSDQFQALVESFREKMVEKAVDHFTLMSMVSAEALMKLHEKLQEEDLQDIPFETLRRLSETFVDRIGHSPIRRSETTNRHTHALDPSAIERIKALHSEKPVYNREDVVDAVLVQEQKDAAEAAIAEDSAEVVEISAWTSSSESDPS